MSKYGPTRREWKFRLAVGVFGLVLLAGAYAFNGINGIASLEIAIISGAFFGGSIFFSIRALRRGTDP